MQKQVKSLSRYGRYGTIHIKVKFNAQLKLIYFLLKLLRFKKPAIVLLSDLPQYPNKKLQQPVWLRDWVYTVSYTRCLTSASDSRKVIFGYCLKLVERLWNENSINVMPTWYTAYHNDSVIDPLTTGKCGVNKNLLIYKWII